MTDAQKDFINEHARKLLAEVWADHFTRTEEIPTDLRVQPYWAAAIESGWVSDREGKPVKVLAKGFSAAAAYLRR